MSNELHGLLCDPPLVTNKLLNLGSSGSKYLLPGPLQKKFANP
jgi:hypothetical protein